MPNHMIKVLPLLMSFFAMYVTEALEWRGATNRSAPPPQSETPSFAYALAGVYKLMTPPREPKLIYIYSYLLPTICKATVCTAKDLCPTNLQCIPRCAPTGLLSSLREKQQAHVGMGEGYGCQGVSCRMQPECCARHVMGMRGAKTGSGGNNGLYERERGRTVIWYWNSYT